ncbi:hypothetical protein BDV96DRAFT_34172 [Lophiotrema nucula]|uniref:Uncharacterized protein n=1 Tax=Lophiotrema nucula TaxID=690887 RepID=A0A6A5ZE62_9PLEO|nr:hypothetical protein BDV96DRAFT_34172 [Lophiotrema nucula]
MSPHGKSTLLAIPYDIRIVLYSHIDLPPFDGHHDFRGLLLSCQQISSEVQKEAALRTKNFLDSVEQQQSDTNIAPEWRWKLSSYTLQSLGTLCNVTISLPFHVPVDYRNQRWHDFGYIHSALMGNTARLHDTDIHLSHLSRTLASLKPLFSLCLKALLINLEAGFEAAAQLRAGQAMIRGSLPSFPVHYVPLGIVIYAYETSLACLCREAIEESTELSNKLRTPFNIRTLTLEWSFEGETAQNKKRDIRSFSFVCAGIEARSGWGSEKVGAVVLDLHKHKRMTIIEKALKVYLNKCG